MNNKMILSILLGSFVLAGCSSTPTIRTAIDKNYEVSGKNLKFGGSYNEDKKELTIMINGEPTMRQTFAPYSPNLNMKAKYDGLNIASKCYFGSVLSRKGGIFGAVAGIVQSSKSSSGDKCELLVNDKAAETLYF